MRDLSSLFAILLISVFLAPLSTGLGTASLGVVVAVEPAFEPAPVAAAPADDDDDDDDEDAEEKEPVEIPPPPFDSLDLPDDLDPKVRAEYEKALELFESARKKFRDKDKRKEAVRAMKRLKKKLPSGEAHFHLGLLYQWDRDYKKAKKVLEELVELQPNFYEAYVELGDVHVWLKDLPAAIPEYERALAIYDHFEYGVDRMMTVLVQVGRFEEAKVFLERALLRGPNPMRLQCKSAVKMVLEGPAWEKCYTVETENYIVKSDVSETFAEEIAENAELIRELYDSLFPEIGKPERKYLVLVFKDRAGYLGAGAPPASGGVYMSLSRRLMLYKLKTMEETIMTLKHEGFHQYCHEYLENIPPWFNEGLADTFAATELVEKGKKRGMQLLPNSKRIDYLARALSRGGFPSLKEIMHMSQPQMYDVENENRAMYLHYCQAWSICYFCIMAGNSKYQSCLKNYFKLLRKGKSQDEVYDATFGQLNMRLFQEQWHAFMLGTARGGG